MSHIHPNGTDFVAEVYIVHNNKVLLRLHDKYKIWLAPGGHVEQDGVYEEPNSAGLREVLESLFKVSSITAQ